MPSVDDERLIVALLEAVEANAGASAQAAQGANPAAEDAARFASAAKDLAEAVNALGIQLSD